MAAALILLLRLMHYARFYAPSYFFWTGAILSVIGMISLVHPLAFLFIMDRTIAAFVAGSGVLVSVVSLVWPVKETHPSENDKEIDALMPEFSFNEFHEVMIQSSPERVKQVLHVTGIKDIPVAKILMQIRGIANDDLDMSDRASKSDTGSDSFSTPDFNFFTPVPDEYVTLMIIKSAMVTDKNRHPAPPEISKPDEFISFNKPGYVKVAMNFRFFSRDNRKTLLTTETRVRGITPGDSRTFGRYWRIIYPGSAIIRRVWLDAVKKKAEKM